MDPAYQQCISPKCGATFGLSEVLTACPRCGNLLDVKYEWDKLQPPKALSDIERLWARRDDPLNFSGVWRFRSLLPFAPEEMCVTVGEGQTLLRPSDAVGEYAGMQAGRLFLQYEGMNPSGSFKDNGMSAAFTHARIESARSGRHAHRPGNTSASLALYCSVTFRD